MISPSRLSILTFVVCDPMHMRIRHISHVNSRVILTVADGLAPSHRDRQTSHIGSALTFRDSHIAS